ncbi:hypothetical protein Tco_0040070 [Tanacetum coccineum]
MIVCLSSTSRILKTLFWKMIHRDQCLLRTSGRVETSRANHTKHMELVSGHKGLSSAYTRDWDSLDLQNSDRFTIRRPPRQHMPIQERGLHNPYGNDHVHMERQRVCNKDNEMASRLETRAKDSSKSIPSS